MRRCIASTARAGSGRADGTGERLTFPEGERSKTRESWSRLTDELLRRGFGRDSGIVALGGGVAGDLAGFVAATYMRGVPYLQVPTTLLAMLDASVGGKTGVDTAGGQEPDRRVSSAGRGAGRSAGARHAARAGLPRRTGGGGEARAHRRPRAISSGWSRRPAALRRARPAALEQLVRRSVEIKADVVSEDEREGGRRAILNAGHTVAHALERASGYRVPHGEAVGLGLVAEAALADRPRPRDARGGGAGGGAARAARPARRACREPLAADARPGRDGERQEEPGGAIRFALPRGARRDGSGDRIGPRKRRSRRSGPPFGQSRNGLSSATSYTPDTRRRRVDKSRREWTKSRTGCPQTFCDVEIVFCLTRIPVNPILTQPFQPFWSPISSSQSMQPLSRVSMAHVRTGKARALLRSSPVRVVRPISPRHPEAPDDHRSRGGEAARAPRPRGRRGGGGAAGDGQPPVRDLLREEVPGPRARPLGAGGDRQRGAAQGGPEVRSRPRRQVHLLRGLVGAPGGAEGAGRADPERADPAQPELRAGAHGAGAELPGPGAGPGADRRGNRHRAQRYGGQHPRARGG